METSLEQALIESTHRAVDDIAKLIPERGLPFSVTVWFSFPDDTYISHNISISDGQMSERETTDEDEPPVLDEARVREIVEETLRLYSLLEDGE